MNKYNHRPICLFCLEDVTAGVHRQRDREAPGGIAPITDCLILGRELNIGFILAVHSITEMSDIIRQNAGVFLVCGLQGENPWTVQNTLGITLAQQEAFRSSKPGEIICVNPVLFDNPVYATFDPPQIPGSCDEIMRQTDLVPFFKKIHTMPPVPLTEFLPGLLPPSHSNKVTNNDSLPERPSRGLELMVNVATNTPTPTMYVYERMGLNATQGRRITKRLEEIGYTQTHTFSTGRKGGRINLIEITEMGWQLLNSRGIAKPKTRTNGDWEHEIAAELLEIEGKKLGYTVSFEVEIGGLRLDVQWLDNKTGQRQLLNIGISRPAHEVDSIEKFFTLPIAHNTPFALVVRDSNFAKKVKEIFKQRDTGGKFLPQITIKLLTDYITV